MAGAEDACNGEVHFLGGLGEPCSPLHVRTAHEGWNHRRQTAELVFVVLLRGHCAGDRAKVPSHKQVRPRCLHEARGIHDIHKP